GDPVDTVTVSQELEAHSLLMEVGGPAYLTQCIRNTPTSTHAEVYGMMVRRCAQRRQLLQAAETIKLLAIDETMDIKKIFTLSEAKLMSVTVSEHKQEDTDIKTIMHEYMDDLALLTELRKQGVVPGLPTGYPSVDAIIGGAYKGELTIIAGPAKAGKSTYNLNVARNRAKAGAHIVIAILEMNRAAVVRKFVSMETDIPVDTLKNAKLSGQQWSRFVEASQKISKWNMHIIDDYPAMSPLDLRRELRRIMHNETVDYVLVDGLWRMASDKPSEKRHEEIARILIDLTTIAAKMKVPIDLVHQFNAAPNTRRDPRPRLSDLGLSISAQTEPYTVILLYRESYYKQDGSDELEVIIAANRDGNMDTAKLGFKKSSEEYFELGRIDRMIIPATNIDDSRKDVYQ
ncbi:hypothetical protein LCGC14_1605150, partial [marine sediment metagenome]